MSSPTEGNVDHVAPLVSYVASPRAADASTNLTNTGNFSPEKKKSKAAVVTKLSTVGSTTTDDFFNSWGDDNEVENDDAVANATPSSAPIDTANEKIKEALYQQINVNDQDASQVTMPLEQSMTQQAAQETHPEESNAWDNDDLDIQEAEDSVESTDVIQSQVTAAEGEIHIESTTEEATPKEGEIHPIPLIENSLKEDLSDDLAPEENAWDDEIDIPDDNVEETIKEISQPANDKIEGPSTNYHTVESTNEVEPPSAINTASEEPLSNSPVVDDAREESDKLDNLDENIISTEVVPKEEMLDEATTNEASCESFLLIENTASAPIVDNEVLEDGQDRLCQSNAEAVENPWAEDDLDITEETNDTHAESAVEESTLSSQVNATIDDTHLIGEGAGELTKAAVERVDDKYDPSNDKAAEVEKTHSNEVGNLNNTDHIAEVDVSNTIDNDIVGSIEKLAAPSGASADAMTEQDINPSVKNAAKDAQDEDIAHPSNEAENHDEELHCERSERMESVGEIDIVTESVLLEEIQADERKASEAAASLGELNDSATKEEAGDAAKDEVSKPVESALVQEQKEADTLTIFEGATDIAAATQSLQSVFENHTSNLFDTSKSSSMFGWSFQNDTATNQAAEATSFDEAGSNPMISQAKPPETKEVSSQPIDDANLINDLYNDDALDDMYDDDSDEEETETDTLNEDKPVLVSDTTQKVGESEGRVVPEPVSQQVVDKFVGQLERMTESHQLEMDELHRTYKLELAKLQGELDDERTKKKNIKARDAVAAHDKHLSAMRELEKTFNKTLQEKDEELEQVMQRNEGFTLKMDSMRREVDGLLKLVDER